MHSQPGLSKQLPPSCSGPRLHLWAVTLLFSSAPSSWSVPERKAPYPTYAGEAKTCSGRASKAVAKLNIESYSSRLKSKVLNCAVQRSSWLAIFFNYVFLLVCQKTSGFALRAALHEYLNINTQSNRVPQEEWTRDRFVQCSLVPNLQTHPSHLCWTKSPSHLCPFAL